MSIEDLKALAKEAKLTHQTVTVTFRLASAVLVMAKALEVIVDVYRHPDGTVLDGGLMGNIAMKALKRAGEV